VSHKDDLRALAVARMAPVVPVVHPGKARWSVADALPPHGNIGIELGVAAGGVSSARTDAYIASARSMLKMAHRERNMQVSQGYLMVPTPLSSKLGVGSSIVSGPTLRIAMSASSSRGFKLR